MSTCSSCDKPIWLAVVLVHRGKEWSLCKECWKPSLAKPPGNEKGKKK